MKKLSTYLFLILFSFQVPSWADDITDFQIEGMSIGDSLLDFYSSEDIELRVSQTIQGYKSDKFIRTAFASGFGSKNFEIYDAIGVHFKKKDSKKGEMNFKEKNKIFDPKKIYKDEPNPTKI